MIAAAIVANISAHRILELYLNRASEVFTGFTTSNTLKRMIAPEREENQKAYVSTRTRHTAEWIFSLWGRGRGPLHHYFSEFFDWNDPPLFKNFLRIYAFGSALYIYCFPATGCSEHEENPSVEDEIKINLKSTEAG
jgi:hypothetical protein